MLPIAASIATRIRITVVLLIAAAALVLIAVIDDQRRDQVLGRRAAAMEESLRLSGATMQQTVETLRQDTLFLSRTPPTSGIFRAEQNGGIDPLEGNSRAVWINRLQAIFSAFAKAHADYFMVRYIGLADGGRELVRVERRNGSVEVASEEALQRKGDRGFVMETARLAKGEVFLSAIDLERDENGLWQPYRPVLRAATPVRDADGNVFGVVVINLEGSALLENATTLPADLKAEGTLFITDDRGHYLVHPDSRRTFTFDRGGSSRRLHDDLPALAPLFADNSTDTFPFGLVDTDAGTQYAVARRLHFDPSRPERFLGLAILIPSAAVQDELTPFFRDAALGGVGMALIIGALILFALGRLLRPLEEVTAAARVIAAGHRDVHLPLGSNGEVGHLAAALRHMLDRVAEREQALYALNADLESRVRERTGKLRLAASVVDNTSEGVLVTDEQATILSVNRAFSKITGYGAEEAIGRKTSLLKSDHHDADFYHRMWVDLEAAGHWQGEIWNRRKGGEAYLEWLVINRIPPEAGFPVNYVAVFHDITEQRLQDERIRHLAFHDPLTGLPNRALFQERLRHALARAQREQERLSITFIDLDGFKAVNDGLGHDVGDLLLQEVAQRIRMRLRRESDTVARLGGDEFVVLMEGLKEPEVCACLADEILDDLSRPMELRGRSVRIGASMGMAFFPEDGRDALELMQRADTAMYAAKTAGKGGYRFFQSDMLAEVGRRLSLESELRSAIEAGQLLLYYQPKVAIAGGGLRGVEALIRWLHPERGLVPPDEFIGIAEETGLILPIGEWVLGEACRQAARWRSEGREITIAVNVSARQILQGRLPDRIAELLERHRIPPSLLEIELTETTLMTDPLQAATTLARLREMGLSIAVDDFGTGYSSLSRLRHLPIDRLKIDRSFVSNADRDARDVEVIRTVIALAHGLGLDVVAEGVESAAQAELLQSLGCQVCQGFLYARPMPAEELTGWSESAATADKGI